MGITLHYKGNLRDKAALAGVLRTAKCFAESKGWRTESIDEADVTLIRVAEDESESTYQGPTVGITIYPHPDCEPLRLDFDRELFVQGYTKTQFAGAETHVQVVELLADLKQFFGIFDVFDESGYWDTRDETVLRQHLEECDAAMRQIVLDNPGSKTKVLTPSGRIMDVYLSRKQENPQT
jgi:hypothetical protein